MGANVAIIYYSATGTVQALAQAVAEGAASIGATVRLRRVAELTSEVSSPPNESPNRSPDQDLPPREDASATGISARATMEDLAWADAIALGTPTRFGTPAAELKHFIDQSVGLWQAGSLADKPVTAFTSASNRHGGSEATILSLSNVFYHWGSLIVPPGYTDAAVYGAGGNPYGTSSSGQPHGAGPDAATLAAARYQGRRLAEITIRLQVRNENSGTLHSENVRHIATAPISRTA